jgi:RecA-family ATPase
VEGCPGLRGPGLGRPRADAILVRDAAAAIGVVPAFVLVDTLSQTFSGEENSAQEVSGYLREIGLQFRACWQCAVLVVHHTGHSATERPRGSSTLRANVDFMFGVYRDEKEMLATVECAKQKDGELMEPVSFSMRVAELQKDEDGDPITSLVHAG